MIHPELNVDTQPPEPKKTFAEKLCTAIAIIISIVLAALAICRSCPVIGECRRFADEHNRINGYQLQGIWGGRRYGVK